MHCKKDKLFRLSAQQLLQSMYPGGGQQAEPHPSRHFGFTSWLSFCCALASIMAVMRLPPPSCCICSQRIQDEASKLSPIPTGTSTESENWSILHRTGPHVWTDSVLNWMHGQGIGFHEALVPGMSRAGFWLDLVNGSRIHAVAVDEDQLCAQVDALAGHWLDALVEGR
jgi:hypothetical protein